MRGSIITGTWYFKGSSWEIQGEVAAGVLVVINERAETVRILESEALVVPHGPVINAFVVDNNIWPAQHSMRKATNPSVFGSVLRETRHNGKSRDFIVPVNMMLQRPLLQLSGTHLAL